jgi:sterol desaturase/sphingolipid hydroxylase (fatty acid hydroxylase superfamily)
VPDKTMLDRLAENFLAVPEGFKEPAIIVGLFVVGAGAYYAYWEISRNAARPGPKAAWRYIFRKELYFHPSTRTDIGNFLLTYVLWFPLMRTVIAAFANLLSIGVILDFLASSFGSRDFFAASGWVVAGQVTLLILSAEFGSYVQHWAAHRVPLLWSIHRAHHSAESLTIFTRLRQHPLDILWSAFGRVILSALCSATILYLAGAPLQKPAAIIYFAISAFIPFGFDVWRHCHMPITLGPLNRIFNAPVMHQIHHSAEERHWDKNLGAELMVFDWLFGTLYLPERDEQYRWGLNPREIGANNPHLKLRDFYLEPFRYARNRLRGIRPEAVAPESPATAPEPNPANP